MQAALLIPWRQVLALVVALATKENNQIIMYLYYVASTQHYTRVYYKLQAEQAPEYKVRNDERTTKSTNYRHIFS